WDAESQAYIFHTYGAPLFNFPVEVTSPYFVTITAPRIMAPAGVENLGTMSLNVPQNEGGYIYNSDGSTPENGNIRFQAYVIGREDEVLTQDSPGCGYGGGWWQINLGNFLSPWTAGEILHVEFYNRANGETGNLDITLEYLGQTTDINLGLTECRCDFYPADGDIDGTDLAIFANSFGSAYGHESYKPWLDLNNDNIIDIGDLVIFAGEFGRNECP
ncbi:MAG: hypothetical protein DRG83_17460, partial [Deltaproteobacteria bacterium]